MRVLCLDPGKEYFAWALVSSEKGLIKSGMLHSTIKSLRENIIEENTRCFADEFFSLLGSCGKVDEIVAERFMVRSQGRSGANCEFITYMLGIIAGRLTQMDIPFYLIMASTWKMYCQRQYGFSKGTPLPELFGFSGLSKNFKTVPIFEHQFDACGMALYWLNKHTDSDLYFKIRGPLVHYWIRHAPTDRRALVSYRKVKITGGAVCR